MKEKLAPAEREVILRPVGNNPKRLYRCPKCGAGLLARNMRHSCGRYSLAALFARSTPSVRQMFSKFARMVRACGRVELIPQKTRAVFLRHVRFVAVYPRKGWMEIGVELPERCPHARFHKIESYTKRMHGHYLRIDQLGQLDRQVQRWLRDAYRAALRNDSTALRRRS